MTRRLMIAGVAVLLAVQSALVPDAAVSQISIEQRSRLDAEIAGVPAELRTSFDELYRDWSRTWQRPDILVSSNSKAVKDSDEFRRSKPCTGLLSRSNGAWRRKSAGSRL